MRMVFVVEAETEHQSGKFMSRDECVEQIVETLEGADPGECTGGPDGDSVAVIMGWEVTGQ